MTLTYRELQKALSQFKAEGIALTCSIKSAKAVLEVEYIRVVGLVAAAAVASEPIQEPYVDPEQFLGEGNEADPWDCETTAAQTAFETLESPAAYSFASAAQLLLPSAKAEALEDPWRDDSIRGNIAIETVESLAVPAFQIGEMQLLLPPCAEPTYEAVAIAAKESSPKKTTYGYADSNVSNAATSDSYTVRENLPKTLGSLTQHMFTMESCTTSAVVLDNTRKISGLTQMKRQAKTHGRISASDWKPEPRLNQLGQIVGDKFAAIARTLRNEAAAELTTAATVTKAMGWFCLGFHRGFEKAAAKRKA